MIKVALLLFALVASVNAAVGGVQCGFVSEGFVDWPPTPAGRVVVINCPETYSGRPIRTCGLDGVWGAITNPCVETYCEAQTLFLHANWTVTRGGVQATGTCDIGYFGPAKRTCRAPGFWNSTLDVPCTRYQCPALPKIDHVSYPITSSLKTMTRVCPTGLFGRPTRYCNEFGVWEPQIGSCLTHPCAGEHFDFATYVDGTPGASTPGQCDTGYSGSPTRLCDVSGSWGAVTGQCTRNQCPQEAFDNAQWDATDSLTTGSGQCDPHYTGSPTRPCDANGAWGTETGSCTRIQCPQESFGNATWPATDDGTTATGIACDLGFTGTVSRACLNGGTWSNSITGSCVRNQCPQEAFDNATWPTTNSLTTASGTCITKFSGNPTRVCTASGAWGAESDPCVPLSCLGEKYGVATFPTTPAGTTAVGSCDPGFSGPAKRACSLTGVWATNMSPVCQRIYCPADVAGNISWNTTGSGLTITQNCPAGFGGHPTRICGLDGNWGTVSNPCFQLTCAGGVFNNALYPTTDAGSSSPGVCQGGTSGSPTRSCSITGFWNTPTGTPCT